MKAKLEHHQEDINTQLGETLGLSKEVAAETEHGKTTFHLNNRDANRYPAVSVNVAYLLNNGSSVYFGVSLTTS